jgi:hypothetical protein
MSAAQSGARSPVLDRSPFATRSGRVVHGNDQDATGFEAGPASGATATECALRVVSVTGAAGFAAAFPVYSQPCVFSTALLRPAGLLATSPIYFFFFFAAFLAFLFFAITSLHQRLKKQAQRPS